VFQLVVVELMVQMVHARFVLLHVELAHKIPPIVQVAQLQNSSHLTLAYQVVAMDTMAIAPQINANLAQFSALNVQALKTVSVQPVLQPTYSLVTPLAYRDAHLVNS